MLLVVAVVCVLGVGGPDDVEGTASVVDGFTIVDGAGNVVVGVGAVSYTHLTLPTTPYV